MKKIVMFMVGLITSVFIIFFSMSITGITITIHQPPIMLISASSTMNSTKSISIVAEQQNRASFSYASNSTHLWSMRYADKDYFRTARLLPCRNVTYVGGPKPETIDSCDHSSTSEYAVQTTLHAQQWLFEHQHPADCTNKRFAIIHNFAWSGFGSTVHQIVWALGMALSQERIAVYATPGNWLYGSCPSGTPDCLFLPITNCSIPSTVDGNKTIRIEANQGHWHKPIYPSIFKNRTFNWYRSQLLFYIMRYNAQTLAYAQNTIAKYFTPPSLDVHRPFIAIYVRRSDKVQNREMSQAYLLKQYFDLFDADAHRAHITTVYVNSEDAEVFKEFVQVNKNRENYYKLLSITVSRNVVFRTLTAMSREARGHVALEFLSDLYIEVHADLHAGTLTSNWCRLVDEMRLVLGKTIPYYTPENRYLLDM